MSVLAYVYKHPDDNTDCPEFSFPTQGACPRVGTGVHKDAPYMPSAVTTEEDILDHFIGPLDVPHMAATGKVRRIVRPRL